MDWVNTALAEVSLEDITPAPHLECVKYCKMSHDELESSATAEAFLVRGYNYWAANGVRGDPALARELIDKAAYAGHPVALAISLILRETPNQAHVITMLEGSVDRGHPIACIVLGNHLECNAPLNINRAVQLYKRASDQGYAPGMYYYAECWQKGYTNELRREDVRFLHRQAACQGLAGSCVNLAAYHLDQGNTVMAACFITKALEKDCLVSQRIREMLKPTAEERLIQTSVCTPSSEEDVARAVKWLFRQSLTEAAYLFREMVAYCTQRRKEAAVRCTVPLLTKDEPRKRTAEQPLFKRSRISEE